MLPPSHLSPHALTVYSGPDLLTLFPPHSSHIQATTLSPELSEEVLELRSKAIVLQQEVDRHHGQAKALSQQVQVSISLRLPRVPLAIDCFNGAPTVAPPKAAMIISLPSQSLT